VLLRSTLAPAAIPRVADFESTDPESCVSSMAKIRLLVFFFGNCAKGVSSTVEPPPMIMLLSKLNRTRLGDFGALSEVASVCGGSSATDSTVGKGVSGRAAQACRTGIEAAFSGHSLSVQSSSSEDGSGVGKRKASSNADSAAVVSLLASCAARAAVILASPKGSDVTFEVDPFIVVT
jgi:hypothetical protein